MRPEVKEDQIMGKFLAQRIARLQDLPPYQPGSELPPAALSALLEEVEDALLRGETHYTVRPGMPELRRRLVNELAAMGGPSYEGIDGTVITSGDAEALFTLLPDFRSRPGVVLTGCPGPCRHERLFELMRLQARPAQTGTVPDAEIRLVYREWPADRNLHEALLQRALASAVPDVLNLHALLASARGLHLPPHHPDRTVFIGNFDSLPGVAAFRVGFLAGPPNEARRAAVWRQAFSICSPGPSQRAALKALSDWQKGTR
jgi:aspartate/methionine/tyrosine aminotransferase